MTLPRTLLLLILLPLALFSRAYSIDLILPTSNTEVFEGHPEEFYQKTVKNSSDAWKSGRYGFVRNPRTLSKGVVVYSRFHEGVDIRPVYRDNRGEPLDTVMAVSPGIVVHVNPQASHSNYGKYIVVMHEWDGSPFYTLYAHLNEVWVDSGVVVEQGHPIGRLGYTGDGINRARAHLHFEVCMMMNEGFQSWYDSNFSSGGTNYHAQFNGMNLAGMDVMHLYEVMRENPRTSMQEFLAGEDVLFTVQFARSGGLDLLRRYPWLLTSRPTQKHRSWRVSFSGSGLPLAIEPDTEECVDPVVCSLGVCTIPLRYASKSLLRGNTDDHDLSGSGERLVALVSTGGESIEIPASVGRVRIERVRRRPRKPEGVQTTGVQPDVAASDTTAGSIQDDVVRTESPKRPPTALPTAATRHRGVILLDDLSEPEGGEE